MFRWVLWKKDRAKRMFSPECSLAEGAVVCSQRRYVPFSIVRPGKRRAVQGCGSKIRMSKQQFGILTKVSEVDAAVRRHAETSFREGHPEVSFALMNGGRPISIGKKKPDGRKERSELVCRYFPDAGRRFDECPHDRADVLDAYALLWTAQRIQRGEEHGFPEERVMDKFGLRMEIVA